MYKWTFVNYSLITCYKMYNFTKSSFEILSRLPFYTIIGFSCMLLISYSKIARSLKNVLDIRNTFWMSFWSQSSPGLVDRHRLHNLVKERGTSLTWPGVWTSRSVEFVTVWTGRAISQNVRNPIWNLTPSFQCLT